MKRLLRQFRSWLESVGSAEAERGSSDGDRTAVLEERSNQNASTSVGTTSPSSDTQTSAEVFMETGLTPAGVVLEQLESNGGQLKQQSIVEYTGWSDSKVSRTLSEMEVDGRITRYRIGNEKLVCLPESQPEPLAREPGNQDRNGQTA